MLNLLIINKLNNDIVKKIENFLLNNYSIFNPLFSSPLWAERLKKLLDFQYWYYIIEERDEIVALLLTFDGYRGYAKIKK